MSTNCTPTYTQRLTKCFCRASWRRPSRRRIMHYYITKLRANTIKVLYVYFLQNLNPSEKKVFTWLIYQSCEKSIICLLYFQTISLDSDDIILLRLMQNTVQGGSNLFSPRCIITFCFPLISFHEQIFFQDICNLKSILPYYIISNRYTEKRFLNDLFFMSNFICVHSSYE